MDKYLFLMLPLLLNISCNHAQETNEPIKVDIKLKKQYVLTFSKDYFANEVARNDYVITKDSVKQTRFDVDVNISNQSKKTIFIWLMSCSWEDNFEVNNNYISIYGSDCNKNVPDLIAIPPSESKIYSTTLTKSIKFQYPCKYCIYGDQVKETKLGLIVINDVFSSAPISYDFKMEDKSAWTIVWSNPLFLLTKDESNPGPVTIPVYEK